MGTEKTLVPVNKAFCTRNLLALFASQVGSEGTHFFTTFHLATVSSLQGPGMGIATLHGVLVETNILLQQVRLSSPPRIHVRLAMIQELCAFLLHRTR